MGGSRSNWLPFPFRQFTSEIPRSFSLKMHRFPMVAVCEGNWERAKLRIPDMIA
jgi:hypothetical protein